MDQYKESNKFLEHKFWGTTISSSNKIMKILMRKNDFIESPFLYIFLKSLKAIDSIDMIFFINGEASL